MERDSDYLRILFQPNMDSVFRSIQPESSLPADATAPDIKPEVKGETPNTSFNPEGNNLVLDTLGINDDVKNMPEESKENLDLIDEFVGEIMKSKQLKTTSEAFIDTLKNFMEDLDINPHTEPIAVLDRMGGVIKGWKNLSFISDPSEKRKIFMKLAKMPDSKSMNRFIFEEMGRREVYA